MAILGEIRKMTWLLIVVIGIAMLAFLAGDLFSENSILKRMVSGDPNLVGVVDGNNITMSNYNMAQQRMNMVSRGQNLNQNQQNQQIWNSLVSQKLIESHAEQSGLRVSDDEVWSYLAKNFGLNSAEEAKNHLAELKAKANNGDSQANQQYQFIVNNFDQFRSDILSESYLSMVNAGVAVTKKEAEWQQIANTQSADVDYAFVSYDDLKKKYKIEVTDDEINAYVKKYPKLYKSEATVDLSYVYFSATPSEKDNKDALAKITSLLGGEGTTTESFANTTNDSIFVTKHSDAGFISNYFTKKEIEEFTGLPEDMSAFLKTASVGQVGGPFKQGNAYQLIKLAKSKPIVDSVQSSHILIGFAGTTSAQRDPQITRTREEAKSIADSVLSVVKSNPSQFNTLVTKYSDDAGSKSKNGSIGWYGRNSQGLAASYLNYIITHSPGDIDLVESEFGYHIIKVDNTKTQTGYQIANVLKNVEPSKETRSSNYNNARDFIQKTQGKSLNDFANIAKKAGYKYNTSDALDRFAVRVIDDPEVATDKDSEILKWAFDDDTKVGSSFLFTTANEDQIIVYKAAKHKKGLASAKAVRANVEPILIQEKLAKTVSEKLNKVTLDGLVSSFGAAKTSAKVNFGNPVINGQPEPKVVGAAFGLKPNSISKVIQGNAGVFVLKTKSVSPTPKVSDVSQLQEQLENQAKQRFTQQLMPSLINSVEIEDNRAKVFN